MLSGENWAWARSIRAWPGRALLPRRRALQAVGIWPRAIGQPARGRRARPPFSGPPKPPPDLDAGPVPPRARAVKGRGAMMWPNGMAE